MRISAIDSMTPAVPDFTDPRICILQLPARRMSVLLLAVLIGFSAVLLSPFYLIATAALADQSLRAVVSTRPLAAVQIMAGLAFWLILLGCPIYRLLDTLTRSREIEIAGGRITVVDHAFGAARSWGAPICDFAGVAPFLRASLAGVRHELILVHPDPKRSVLIAMAPRLLQSEVDRVALALGVSELTPQALRQRRAARS